MEVFEVRLNAVPNAIGGILVKPHVSFRSAPILRPAGRQCTCNATITNKNINHPPGPQHAEGEILNTV